MKRTHPAVGIRRHRGGWQAYIRINGQLHMRSFPLESTRDEMQAWRRAKRAEFTTESAISQCEIRLQIQRIRRATKRITEEVNRLSP